MLKVPSGVPSLARNFSTPESSLAMNCTKRSSPSNKIRPKPANSRLGKLVKVASRAPSLARTLLITAVPSGKKARTFMFEPSKAIERSAGIGNCATWFRLYQRRVDTASGLGTGASQAEGACSSCAWTGRPGGEICNSDIVKAKAAQKVDTVRSKLGLFRRGEIELATKHRPFSSRQRA